MTTTHKSQPEPTPPKGAPHTQVEQNAAKAATGRSPDAVGGLQNDANPEARNPNPTALADSREGEGTIPHPGGANAKPGVAFSGGCVPEEPDVPVADSAAKKA